MFTVDSCTFCASGDKERDYDFLSSIEILSLFMSDVFLMQNWEHLVHCLEHLNLQPSSPQHTDFSRWTFVLQCGILKFPSFSCRTYTQI